MQGIGRMRMVGPVVALAMGIGAFAGTASALATSCGMSLHASGPKYDLSLNGSSGSRLSPDGAGNVTFSGNAAVACTGGSPTLSNLYSVTYTNDGGGSDNFLVDEPERFIAAGAYFIDHGGPASNDQFYFYTSAPMTAIVGDAGGGATGFDLNGDGGIDALVFNGESFGLRGLSTQPDYFSALGNLDPRTHDTGFSGPMTAGVFLDGGEGNDTLVGGNGGDTLDGFGGNDLIVGGRGGDYVYGGSGIDTFSYLDHHSAVRAQPGNGYNDGSVGEGDFLHSDIENLIGGTSSDKLYGTNVRNRLDGGPGNDRLYGLGGDDKLYGDAGKDRLTGGDGRDMMFGMTGIDKLFAKDGNKDKRIDCGPGSNRREKAKVDHKDPVPKSC